MNLPINPEAKAVAAYVDAAVTVIGISIAPDWRAGVANHLAIILANAEMVAGHDASSASEPAPVFEAS